MKRKCNKQVKVRKISVREKARTLTGQDLNKKRKECNTKMPNSGSVVHEIHTQEKHYFIYLLPIIAIMFYF